MVSDLVQQPWPAPIEGFIFDLDGTVYRGDTPIPGAIEALHRIRAVGIPMVFMTNNSTQSRAAFAAKLTSMGFEADAEQVVNTAYATALHLQRTRPQGGTAYVVGAEALSREVEAAGFTVTEREPDVVVVGLDRELTYAKLRTAVHAILGGADFVATNPDRLIPHGADLDPGAGTLVAAVEAATSHVTHPTVIGKPEPLMPLMALSRLRSSPERTVAVGDQVLTDVAAAKRAGMYAVLVETGVPMTQIQEALPDRVISDLAGIPVG